MRIALIGAGSVVFAKNLLSDIFQFPELENSEICLMDIDPSRLKVADKMARRLAAAIGVSPVIRSTLDQREAIRGAKYVICTIQVGGYEPGTVIDFEIPKKYGLRQTIADTIGVGGIFRGLRTIPVINKIARDIADYGAPGCLLLNYTNPMAMICWAVDKSVGIPHVGLCHSVQSTSKRLAAYAGLDYEEVTYLVAGVNHMAFFLKFAYKGRDAYPLLFRKLNDAEFGEDRVRFEMMRRCGYFVTESSEHQSEYLPYFIHHGEKVVKQFDIPLDEYLRRCQGVIETWEATEKKLLGEGGSMEVPRRSHEYGSSIIHSCETNCPRTIYGNVPNTGLIENLPERCCVEVPCLVDGQGVQPVHVGTLPPQLAMLCQSNVQVQSLAVEAAMTGKREHVYHAVMADPNAASTLTLDAMWKMCDELIEAHQQHGLLGDFEPVVRNTGRSSEGLENITLVWIERVVNDSDHVRIRWENPLAENPEIEFSLVLIGWGGEVLQRQSVSVQPSVIDGNELLVSLSFPESPEEGFKVVAEEVADSVLVVDLSVPPRRLIGGEESEARFCVELDGTPAVSGWIENRGEALALEFSVDDSNILIGKLPWSGSSLELFFAPAEGGSGFQVILVPGKGEELSPKLVDAQSHEIEGAELEQEAAGSGYQVRVVVPKKSLKLSPDADSFLLDCYVNINALGDAHSGGRSSLSGGFNAHLGAHEYSLVTLAAIDGGDPNTSR
ncbi:alpha-galactosidase [Puniceicoccus vermicola]|uniref:Alpha-glucosidase/alpha-galactosidase n=1 Tax=Puniceicoccus vermicola TaxID=388746 RepID=A0A7X1AZL9_9BACT|nr:alpha-glucosidase/alpha-galactosidase [Puniceicoccus vermicola]MBC2602903.1 alpha-glucosidase/alpha-galactosidase [Puniceicoccus vermicola]